MSVVPRAGRAVHMAMTMANGSLPQIALVKLNCAVRRARGAHGHDNGKWQATSHYLTNLQLRRAPGALGAHGNGNGIWLATSHYSIEFQLR
eukprot:396794-Karenia_brevis.AAC.1